MTTTSEEPCGGCEKCFCDPKYFENCILMACCDGYMDNDCTYMCKEKIYGWCDFYSCCDCYISWNLVYYYTIPSFCAIFLSFWLMIISFVLFMPPMIPVLMGLKFLRADKLKLFEICETRIQSADPSQNGHVADPSEFLRRGWFKMFLVTIGLCILGWIPGVFFAFGLVIYYWVQLFKNC